MNSANMRQAHEADCVSTATIAVYLGLTAFALLSMAVSEGYDFSKGERGKFFRKNAKLNLPVYLDDEIQSYLQERAKSKGVAVAQLVNEMLRQDIKLIEEVK